MKNITTDLLIKCLYENSEGTKYFSLLVVLPDGLLASVPDCLMASASAADTTIKIWNINTGITIKTLYMDKLTTEQTNQCLYLYVRKKNLNIIY